MVEWSGFGHDNQNTFNYEHPLPERQITQLEPLPEPTEDVDTAEGVDDPIEVVPDMAPDAPDATDVDTDPVAPPAAKDEGCCSVAQDTTPNAFDLLALAALAALLIRRRRQN
jgi:hypothetical protein